jgi:hypothetical protein
MFSLIVSLRKSLFVKKAPLITMFFFTLAVLLPGCKQEPDEVEFVDRQFIPAGDWADEFGGSYKITKSTIEYSTPAYEDATYPSPATNLKGNIITAVDFSEASGVLIITVTSASNTGNTPGKYTAVYYKEYTPGHVFLANPIDATSYAPIEVDTLNLALATFTEGNVGTYVSFWGSGYTK